MCIRYLLLLAHSIYFHEPLVVVSVYGDHGYHVKLSHVSSLQASKEDINTYIWHGVALSKNRNRLGAWATCDEGGRKMIDNTWVTSSCRRHIYKYLHKTTHDVITQVVRPLIGLRLPVHRLLGYAV